MKYIQSLAVGILLLSGSAAFAHGDSEQKKDRGAQVKEQKEWGIAGDAKMAKRTIKIEMLDTMRFKPDRIKVKRGETLRLLVSNTGQVMHEYVLGTKAYIDEHAELMKKFPEMEHDEPHMAHVGPGKKGEIVWTFNQVGEFYFACLLPGHYESGMVGKVVVVE